MFSLISLVDSARSVIVKIIVINGDSTNWFSASTTTYVCIDMPRKFSAINSRACH